MHSFNLVAVTALTLFSLSNAHWVSHSGRCGPRFGLTCAGSAFGSCCSTKNWCGTTANHCGVGKCRPGYGTCDGEETTSPSPDTDSATVSRDGTCGGSKGYTCASSVFGNCCSRYGWCGSSSAYCGTGCNPEFGTCSSSPSPPVQSPPRASCSLAPQSSTLVSPSVPPSSTLAVTKNARCGKGFGFTCQGSAWGDCCSQYSYCGSTSAYCGTGCQNGFGKCNDGAVSPSSRLVPSFIPASSSSHGVSSTVLHSSASPVLSSPSFSLQISSRVSSSSPASSASSAVLSSSFSPEALSQVSSTSCATSSSSTISSSCSASSSEVSSAVSVASTSSIASSSSFPAISSSAVVSSTSASTSAVSSSSAVAPSSVIPSSAIISSSAVVFSSSIASSVSVVSWSSVASSSAVSSTLSASSTQSIFYTTIPSQPASATPSASPCSYLINSGFETTDVAAWMAFEVGVDLWSFDIKNIGGHAGSAAYLAAVKDVAEAVEMNLDYPFTTSRSLTIEATAYVRSQNSGGASCNVDVLVDDQKHGDTVEVTDASGWVKITSGSVQISSGAHAVRFHVASSAGTGQECSFDDVKVQLVGADCAASLPFAHVVDASVTTLVTAVSSAVFTPRLASSVPV